MGEEGAEKTKTVERFSEDPFAEEPQYNFKKSKSDKKVAEQDLNRIEEDMFENSGDRQKEVDIFGNVNQENILSGKHGKNKQENDFQFDDNFSNFGNQKQKKKENIDFGFEDNEFGDQFGNPSKKKEKEDFNFDFTEKEEEADNRADSFPDARNEDPFKQEAIRIEPRPSENLDFDDPFGSNEQTERKHDQDKISKMSEGGQMGSEKETLDDPFVQNSAGRKK